MTRLKVASFQPRHEIEAELAKVSGDADRISEGLRELGADEGMMQQMLAWWGERKTAEVLRTEFQRGDTSYDPPTRKGSLARSITIAAFGRVYMRLVREMGVPRTKARVPGPPPPAKAWLEILQQRGHPKPTFAHPAVGEGLESLGGYPALARLGEDRARREFIRLYKDLVRGW